MDFARKQLEKYGWSDGKGLGKHENGISQALKPKLKRSVAGIGHDAAADFTEHWWSTLYDKAARNVEVTEKNGETKKIKTKDDKNFVITNSTWRLNNKPSDNKEEYSGFVKTVVLTEGGTKTENLRENSDGEEETTDVFKMTDEELFAACEGRTAHKGARFGLRATGKLSRIQAQEQKLLTEDRFSDYSQAKKVKKDKACVSDLQVVEDMSLNSDNDGNIKKKKKKKHCLSKEVKCKDTNGSDAAESLIVKKDKCKKDCELEEDNLCNVSYFAKKTKRKADRNEDVSSFANEEVKNKQKNVDKVAKDEHNVSEEDVKNSETSKEIKNKRKYGEVENQVNLETHVVVKKKKKKNKE